MMSFFDTLENLRQRPVEERKAIAIGVAALIAGLIAAGWLATKLFILAQQQGGDEEDTIIEAREERATSSFEALRQSISEQVDRAQQESEGLRDLMNQLRGQAGDRAGEEPVPEGGSVEPGSAENLPPPPPPPPPRASQ